MNKQIAAPLTLLPFILLTTSGCQMANVFYHPSVPPSFQPFSHYDVVLAADFIQQPQPTTTTTTERAQSPAPPIRNTDAKKTDAAQPKTDENDQGKSKEDSDESDDEKKRAYTAPGAQYQRLAILAVGVAAFGISDVSGMGRESAESQLTSPTAIVGRPGLSAPPPTVTNAIVGRPGLQQGFAAGLGPASDRNIFTARMNTLSGANGRCQDLVNAGFFNRDRAACESNFRR